MQRDYTYQPDGTDFDIFIIGGGINGCGVARDAAGRGLNVGLAEMNDLASATSSGSTKLFHGGLRYLEFFEFRLVREALRERETLLRAMPHISWPMRFVLPFHRDMRFETGTPTSRILGAFMPWLRGRRPSWLIRFGLFLYDTLGGRKILPGTRSVDLTTDAAGVALKPKFRKAFEYSDCWVEDSRLVVLNARDAEARGATILTRTKVTRAVREGQVWVVTLENTTTRRSHSIKTRILVNAAGPWVENVIRESIGMTPTEGVRLVRGSHIVTRKLFDHDRCYFFQGTDGRIIFAIPYETDFTLIGTTDAEHADSQTHPECSGEERDYLCRFASEYFKAPVTPADIVWTYSGVRPLYDDGATSATAATREYVLKLDTSGDAPLLNIFGGKITTYRRLAESALSKVAPFFPGLPDAWTAGVALPGGDFPFDGVSDQIASLRETFPFLNERWATRLVRAYGTDAFQILGDAKTESDLGLQFGATLSQAEVHWMMTHEYAMTAEDVVWRRTRLGLRMSAEQIAALDKWMQSQTAA